MSTRTQGFNKSNGTTISSAGIYTNCEIALDYVLAVSSAGNAYKTFKVTVTLEDGSSKTFNIMKPSRGFPREIEVNGVKKLQSDKEALLEAEDKVLEFAHKIVSLVDRNNLDNIEAEEFDDIALELVRLAKENQDKYDPRFNVKIVLDKNFKYTQLGKYPNSTLELYKEGKESKLKFSDKDRVTEPDTEGNTSSDSILAGTSSNLVDNNLGMGNDSLPF